MDDPIADVRSQMRYSWPPALLKALIDPFEYTIGMKDGRVISFCQCKDLGGGWVFLWGRWGKKGYDMDKGPYVKGLEGDDWVFDRGLEVRVSDISWAADCPQGS